MAISDASRMNIMIVFHYQLSTIQLSIIILPHSVFDFSFYVSSLNLSLTPDLELLSCGIYFSDELVHVRIAIEVSPKNLPVLRIISSCEVLLSSVVNDWNTN